MHNHFLTFIFLQQNCFAEPANRIKGRKTLVDHFVNSIVVYDDKILINLNYKKGSKQISFKEIENSGLSSGSMSCLGPYKTIEEIRWFLFFSDYISANNLKTFNIFLKCIIVIANIEK